MRSTNLTVRDNALEFLDNVLKPDLAAAAPLLDSQVSIDERIRIANQLVGAPLETAEQAVTTLLASEDSWLKTCGVFAVGALRMQNHESDVQKLADAPDPTLRENVQIALSRLTGEPDTPQPTVSGGMESGVG